jgi:hypothetical protein
VTTGRVIISDLLGFGGAFIHFPLCIMWYSVKYGGAEVQGERHDGFLVTPDGYFANFTKTCHLNT